MLKFFSRLERTRNLVLLFFAIFMAASLVFFYAPTRNAVSENLGQSTETAAKVGSESECRAFNAWNFFIYSVEI